MADNQGTSTLLMAQSTWHVYAVLRWQLQQRALFYYPTEVDPSTCSRIETQTCSRWNAPKLCSAAQMLCFDVSDWVAVRQGCSLAVRGS